jgi:hypothetical protein
MSNQDVKYRESSSWKESKSNVETFEMIRPGIPEKAMKGISVRKGDP